MSESSTTQIELIMRQTDYDLEKASQKLIEHDGDVLKVVREYMGPSKPNPYCTNKMSKNQQVFKEIRSMMDEAARNYELKKAQA